MHQCKRMCIIYKERPVATTDLSRKLDDLLGSSLIYEAVAGHAKCDASTVFRIRQGQLTNPSYSVGKAIDDLHGELLASGKRLRRDSAAGP